MANNDNMVYLALDVGDVNVGLAIANSMAKMASPLGVLHRGEDFVDDLKKTIEMNNVSTLIVGLPRGLDGQETDQTNKTRIFAKDLKRLGLPVYLQDEALSSVEAEKRMKQNPKRYNKDSLDAWAATIILEDYLKDNHRNANV